MAGPREISGKDFLRDLRSGMSDFDLMDKYRLTEKGLTSVFNRLLEVKLITLSELQARSNLRGEQPDLPSEFRMLPRDDLHFPLPIFEKTAAEVRGLVHDIAEHGIGVRGIPARQNEIKIFVIAANEFLQTEPIVLEAKCRWVKGELRPENFAAGFEIMQVLSGNLEELQKLIRGVTVEDLNTVRQKK